MVTQESNLLTARLPIAAAGPGASMGARPSTGAGAVAEQLASAAGVPCWPACWIDWQGSPAPTGKAVTPQ